MTNRSRNKHGQFNKKEAEGSIVGPYFDANYDNEEEEDRADSLNSSQMVENRGPLELTVQLEDDDSNNNNSDGDNTDDITD